MNESVKDTLASVAETAAHLAYAAEFVSLNHAEVQEDGKVLSLYLGDDVLDLQISHMEELVENLEGFLNEDGIRHTLSLANPYPAVYEVFSEMSYAELVLRVAEVMIRTLKSGELWRRGVVDQSLFMHCYKEYERASGDSFPDQQATRRPSQADLPKVTIDGDDSSVEYMGQTFASVEYQCAVLLQELCLAYPLPKGLTTDSRPQPRRIIERLPDRLKSLIVTSNKGSVLSP